MQYVNCTTCDSAREVYGLLSVTHLTIPEEEPEGKMKLQNKAIFLDPDKGLEAATKYMCEFDTEKNIVVTCSNVESEIYRPRAQGKRKQETLIEWLDK
jgi:hypothetical protein